MSPVGAYGGNCAIESVAALANCLNHHLRLCSDTSANNDSIQSIFKTYQRTREARVRKIASSVHLMTRLGTWDGYTMKFIARYILPWLNEVKLVNGLVKDAVKVDFLPLPKRSKGFFDQTGETEQAMQKSTKPAPSWTLILYAFLGLIACTMLLAPKNGNPSSVAKLDAMKI